jgi:hypothetical protein
MSHISEELCDQVIDQLKSSYSAFQEDVATNATIHI